ncbi:hypothetical protein [Nocardioides sp. CF8]|uniref:hypothetical protein n=1 Tax=Nocardioides sp. CF8 TaxID=110319 RepID=UPI0012EBE6BF|nr:hypothetical protein [Nocardioides sp. CF8]
MPVSSRTPMRRRRALTATVATVGLLVALAGCTDDPAPQQPTAEPTAESTPLADYDTSGLTLTPDDFCARVAEPAVIAALDGESTGTDAWQPGRRLPGSRDISDEFGCSWQGSSTTARAWVFAPPVSPQRARDFVRETPGQGCERLSAAADLGSPSVAQQCPDADGRTGVYGLVGSAWVACELSGLRGSREERAGEWCVAVLEALRTT